MAKRFGGGIYRNYPYPYRKLRSWRYKLLQPTISFDTELQWRNGGSVLFSPELQWRNGGWLSWDDELQWVVAPSPNRIQWALEGRFGPVVYSFSYERRTKTNQYVDDVTPAILACTIDLNNDRDVLRTARFTVDASAKDSNNETIVLNTLSDHIAVFMDLLVDFTWTERVQIGLFALSAPKRRITPVIELWDVAASDVSVHLVEATTTAPYTVASGQNYITGTNGVKSIIDAYGLKNVLPNTSSTLPADITWPPGTPWLQVVNDLLHGVNMYSVWFDTEGNALSRTRDDLSDRTPDVTYTSDEFIMAPFEDEQDTTRFANQIVAVVNDPNRAILYSTKTNSDPDNPISTVTLGRTITKVLHPNTIADQTTLNNYALTELQQSAAVYKRSTIQTPIDPRRGAHEVYSLVIDGVAESETWWARNWTFECKVGGTMKHTLGRVHKLVAS